MSDESLATIKRKPAFGTLSIAAPVIGGLICYLIVWVWSDFEYCMLGFVFLGLAPFFGVGFALVALARREKYQALSWIGLVVNVVVLYLLFC